MYQFVIRFLGENDSKSEFFGSFKDTREGKMSKYRFTTKNNKNKVFILQFFSILPCQKYLLRYEIVCEKYAQTSITNMPKFIIRKIKDN